MKTLLITLCVMFGIPAVSFAQCGYYSAYVVPQYRVQTYQYNTCFCGGHHSYGACQRTRTGITVTFGTRHVYHHGYVYHHGHGRVHYNRGRAVLNKHEVIRRYKVRRRHHAHRRYRYNH